MANKGDRAYLEPQAQRLYAEGYNLTDIATRLDVSVTSLAKWKSESKRPSADMDEWDRARGQKKGNIQRLRDLFEEQLAYLEGLSPSGRTAPLMDTLSKMGSLLERWDKIETAQRVAEQVVKTVEKDGSIGVEDLEKEIRRIYGV